MPLGVGGGGNHRLIQFGMGKIRLCVNFFTSILTLFVRCAVTTGTAIFHVYSHPKCPSSCRAKGDRDMHAERNERG